MSTQRTRVVITGIGAVTPLALSAEETWQGLVAGRCGIDYITQLTPEALARFPTRIAGEVKGFDPKNYMEFRDAKRMGRFSQFAVTAAGTKEKFQRPLIGMPRTTCVPTRSTMNAITLMTTRA